MSNRIRRFLIAVLLVPFALPVAAQDSAAVSALQSKGQALLQAGQAAEGIKAFEDAVALAKKEYGPDDERTLLVQGSLAGAYQAVARFDDAVALYEKVASAVEAKYGPDHPQTYLLICGLGKFYNTASRYDDALKCFHRSLTGLEKTLEPGHVAILEALEGLINTYINAGRAALAEPYIRRKIQILETKNGPGHPDTVTAQGVLAGVLAKLNRFDDAEASIERSVEGLKTRAGPDDVQTVRLQAVLAQLKIVRGHPDEAKPLLENALAVLERKRGRDDPDTCKVMGILGDLYRTKSQFDKAEPLLRDNLRLTQGRVGLAHADTLEAYLRLSGLLIDMGRKEEAVALLRTGLNTIEQRIGRNHQGAVGIRNALASLGQPTGKSPAVPARAEIVGAFGKGSLEATLGANLIEMQKVAELVKRGRFAEAEATQKRVLATLQEKFGADHPVTATLLAGLSSIYLASGRLKDSEEFARRALAVYDVKFGSDHPHTAAAREVLAKSLVQQDRVPEAFDSLDNARRARRRLLEQTLPALSEDDQVAFLQSSFTGAFNLAMGAVWSAKNRPGVAEKSASWVLNHKAVALSALAQRAVLARQAADPRVAPIVRDLTEARRRLASLATATVIDSSDSAGPKREFDQLIAHERELSRQLGQALNLPHHDDPWVELDDTRAALPPDAVLVEFARYDVGTPQHGNVGRYAAWVIPPPDRGTVRLIDLGQSGPSDEAIAAVRRAMRLDRTPGSREGDASSGTDDRSGLTRPGGAKSRRETESDAEKRLAPALESLARLILRPLRPHIESARRWVISPDSALWLVPWQALPLDDGRYAIERHLIHLVVSGRELASPGGTNANAPPVIFADPDFNLGGSPDAVNPAPSAFHVSRLPGTAIEADQVAPRLAQYAGSTPAVYKQAEATEARFRELGRPSVLILSTHGFFLDQSEPSSSARLPENPLLRCGLLLAGANQRGNAAAAGGDNSGLDGVLTGLEIVGANLQGTGLVVLSACETGLGQVQSGEGVAGLRQSFQLAGARSIVATLWQIPDAESAQLMIGFFSKLSSGLGPASALRRAQLEQISSRRQQNGAAHPYYWAAFTLTGQPGANWASESLGDDALVPPAPESLAQGPGADQTRGRETAPASRPADAAALSAGSTAQVGSPSPAPTAQPGRTDTDNPFVDWAVMIVVVVCATAAARWWWLRGPQGTV